MDLSHGLRPSHSFARPRRCGLRLGLARPDGGGNDAASGGAGRGSGSAGTRGGGGSGSGVAGTTGAAGSGAAGVSGVAAFRRERSAGVAGGRGLRGQRAAEATGSGGLGALHAARVRRALRTRNLTARRERSSGPWHARHRRDVPWHPPYCAGQCHAARLSGDQLPVRHGDGRERLSDLPVQPLPAGTHQSRVRRSLRARLHGRLRSGANGCTVCHAGTLPCAPRTRSASGASSATAPGRTGAGPAHLRDPPAGCAVDSGAGGGRGHAVMAAPRP
jgi:hypothetical protein